MILVVFVDTCGTGKRNRAGALVLGNWSIVFINHVAAIADGRFLY